MALLNERYLIDFFQCRYTGKNLCQCGLAQEGHAFLVSHTLDIRRGLSRDDHIANPIGQVEQLMNGRSPAKARTVAFQASGTLIEIEVRILAGIQPRIRELLGTMTNRPLAISADHPDEPLSQNTIQGRNEVVRVDTHVEK